MKTTYASVQRSNPLAGWSLGLAVLVIGILMSAPSARAGVTFTTNALIDSANLAYEGQDIVVQGCTVTVNGVHGFNSLSLLSTGVVTHAATTPSQEYSLTLTLANNLTVDGTSKIDVSGRGYQPGYTLGNTNLGGAIFTAGGSYGGFGEICCGGGSAANAVYGDYHNPNELGSGSGTYNGGSPGGGLVRITSVAAQVDGGILANGGTGPEGGSGGGVWLNVGTLSGSGQITANGGAGSGYDGGGGGRVAIYYGSSTFNLSSNVTANAGDGPNGPGSVGTVYLQPTGGSGQLVISSHGTPTAIWTPLGAQTDAVFQVDTLLVSGTNVVAAPAHQMAMNAGAVSVLNAAVLTQQPTTAAQEYSLLLTVTNNLVVDAASSIDVSGRGYLPGYTLGNTNLGAAVYTAGGSYGGFGQICCGGGSAPNATYGQYANPNELGSGSGTYNGGSPGGGLVRITAGLAQVDGGILANGGTGPDEGGSGGGIWLSVGTLSGSGQIAANGGNGGGYDGGGGGRVALYYTSSTFNLSNNVTANAGNGPSGPGSVGTVYLKPAGGLGQLVISSHGTPTGVWTPLGAGTDAVFQVDMLLVSGTNVVAAPEHQMAMAVGAVSILNAAVLTHQPTTAAQEYSLLLTVTNNLVVDGASRIDVSGRGYLPGYTLGNTSVGAAIYTAGGSYGGLGQVCCGGGSAPNAVYGQYANPNELGSGSGTYSGGSPGGGLVRIAAGTAQVDGAILANGGTGPDEGGSGGGLWLSAGTLSGSGQIAANGGNGIGYDGGGGGRVALYYSSSTFNLSSNVTANAGDGPEGPGSVGTVYLKPAGGLEQLVLNSHGTPAGQWTPLGVGTDAVFQVDMLLVSGTNVAAAPEHQMAMEVGAVSILDGAVLTHQATTPVQEYSLLLTVASNLLVDGASRIDTSGRGYLPGYTLGNTTSGAAYYTAGGSYGGSGGLCCGGTDNAVYGDYHNPNELGSGSGTYSDAGAPGGGLARIAAGAAQVDGAILANGGNGSDQGGSGGGIWLSVGTLSGSGEIAANGGAGNNYDGGGGGRVAIYYGSSTFGLSSNATAKAGTGNSAVGSVGTVYLKQTGSLGQLVISSQGAPVGSWTPLGQTNDLAFTAEALVLSGTGTVAATVSGAPIQVASVSLVNGAVLTHQVTTATQEYSLVLTVTNELLVDATSSINVSGRGYLPGYTLGNTTAGAAAYTAGGSYGGSGGLCCGSTDSAVYGDYHNPNELGSGSGTYANAGASGGGLVRITAATAQVDGAILANGGNGPDQGGSGGGVLVNAGTLSGSGRITANGGAGNNYDGGGGGRVAIYYSSNTFNLSSNVTATAGNGNSAAGSVGTVYFMPAGGPGELVLSSHGTPVGQWTPLGVGTDAVFQADTLLVSGTNVVAAPEHQMAIEAAEVSIIDGALLTHQPTTPAQEYSLLLTVTSNLLVDGASRINVSGRGYLPGYTLGNTTVGAAGYTAGGSYGGLGGLCCNSSSVDNALYGLYENPNELGSGSGTYGNGGAPGGGLVRITAASAQVDGAILANGGNGPDQGGSGGGILVNAGALSGSGQITANGGAGANYDGGGGGRVAIYAWTATGMHLAATNVLANGGRGPSAGGQTGTVYLASQPFVSLLNVPQFWHGVEQIAWEAIGIDPKGSDTANLVVSSNGVTYFEQGVPTTGSIPWDTTTVSNGNFTLTMNFFGPSGNPVGLISQNILIDNAVDWHEGTLTANQTWASGTIHVVDANVIVPSGVTLTISPGAIVKFTKGTGIVIQAGGILNALGTSAQPIILTSFADDSAGGDTNLDGNRSQPQPGDWSGVAVLGGQFNYNAFVDIRYSESTVGGTIATSQSWLGNAVYLVSNSVVVPTGVTLTINPGAVVKFVAGTGLTVQSGGTLNALGTVAQPITFTSINDDSVGGVSNNGASTGPAAGDWVGLNISGQASLSHCNVSYGGNTGAGAFASGVIIVNSGSLALSNSVISTALYDGLSIYGSTGTGVVVNTVLRYLDRAIWAWGGGNVRLVNCTFDQNIAGLVNHGGGAIDAENCIIANSIQGSVTEGGVTVRYSDLWSSYANAVNPITIGQNGNISTNPMFINEPLGDYRLNYNSPCINAADGAVAPASDLQGYPPYNDPLISTKTGVANAAGIYPDMGAFAFVEGAPSDVDLVVTTVSGPATVTAGQVVTVQWTDANPGTGTATGPWHDTVSLVSSTNANTVLTLGAVLVGQGAVLGAGQTYSASASFAVPGGTEGNYFWQVHVNSSGDVYEGANWTNNITLSTKPTTLSVPALAVGGAGSNILLSASSPYQWYKFVATSNADIVVSLNLGLPGSGVQLFAGTGYMPTPQQYDFTQNQFDSSAPTMTIPAVAGQTYYILVYGQSLPPGTSAFALQAQVPNFEVSSINPTSVGNAGAVTFELLGAQLAAGTAVSIVSPKGIVQPALTNYLANSALAYASFDLSNAVTGLWSLQVTSGGAAITLTNAFQVLAGGGPNLTAEVVGNDFIRVGLPYQYTLTYNNAGDDDAYYALIVLTGVPTNATVTLGPEFAAPSQPQGVTNPAPTYAGTGGGLTLTPLVIDRLRPGEGGSATFTLQVPAGTPAFSITPEVLGPAAEPLPNAFFSKASLPGSKLSLPCFPADQDLAGAGFLLGLAVQYGATGNFALGGWAKSGNACVGEAAFMKGIYDNESLLTSSPISGWTFTIVTKNGFGIGHTTVVATAPSGNSYIIDNYVSPTIIPMVGVKGQWNISPDCYIFGSPTGNAFIALDLLIETAGGGFFWTEPPTESSGPTCPLPHTKPPLQVTPKSSYDPNLKVGPETGTPQGYVSAQQPLTYEIGFANEATASAPAQEVTVTDALSPNLDWSTLQLQTIGFNNVSLTLPSGAQAFTTQTNVSTDPNPVLVTASFDPSTGLLSWDIKSTDPATGGLVEDVLAGFLPPDNAQGAGEGFVTYTVKPKPGLPTGAVITNQASIVFDVNPPILTGTTTNTIDVTPPTSMMATLPATSPPTFTVSWSGTDLGSGVASFNIYASTNAGAWGPWLLGTTNTSATFTGASGNTYAFYSVAINLVGNIETSPVIPGAQTTVGAVQTGPLLSHFEVSNGQFQFTLNLTSTNSFVIQASTDLKTWTSLLTNQAPFTFVDTNSARSGRRFYRTQTLP